MRLSPPGTHFTAESTEAMQIKCLAEGHNILMPGDEQSTSVSRNRNSNQTTNMLLNNNNNPNNINDDDLLTLYNSIIHQYFAYCIER